MFSREAEDERTFKKKVGKHMYAFYTLVCVIKHLPKVVVPHFLTPKITTPGSFLSFFILVCNSFWSSHGFLFNTVSVIRPSQVAPVDNDISKLKGKKGKLILLYATLI
jgi:hypothetical protein